MIVTTLDWANLSLKVEKREAGALLDCRAMGRTCGGSPVANIEPDGSLQAIYNPNSLPDVERMVEEYAGIFREPVELPPARQEDHEITLLPGMSTPSQRPLGMMSESQLKKR